MNNDAKLSFGMIVQANKDSPDGHWTTGTKMRVAVPLGEQQIDGINTAYVFILNSSLKKRDRYIYEVGYDDIEIVASGDDALMESFKVKVADIEKTEAQLKCKKQELQDIIAAMAKGPVNSSREIMDILNEI